MKTVILFTFFLTICCVSLFAQQNRNPARAEFVTSDIENFWRAFDLADKETNVKTKTAIFQREYLDKGSDGLKGFINGRIGSAENLVAVIRKHPRYYASIRPETLRLAAFEKQSRRSFKKLKEIYPDANFPNVYYVVGTLNSGGTFSADGLIIGAEMYALTEKTPREELSNWLRMNLKSVETVPYIVAHELIHVQQKYPKLTTLLAKAVQEGSADFLAEKIAGKHVNIPQHIYGNANERQLWQEFRVQMNGAKIGDWLYNGDNSKDRPADLGYYMGHKISEAYYKNAKNKRQAIRDILEVKDFPEFLEKSRYREKFAE